MGEYLSGINHLLSRGLHIKGIVCDGKRGLFTAFGSIPIQMCHFHQVTIVTRYITRNPKLEAGIKLKTLAYSLTHSTRSEFEEQLDVWHNHWKKFLDEKSYNEKNRKWSFTHRKIRSAYRSLKTKLRVHSALKEWRKRRIIDKILSK